MRRATHEVKSERCFELGGTCMTLVYQGPGAAATTSNTYLVPGSTDADVLDPPTPFIRNRGVPDHIAVSGRSVLPGGEK